MPRTKGAKSVKLTDKQKKRMVDLYSSDLPRKDIVTMLTKEFGIVSRTVRKLATDLSLSNNQSRVDVTDNVMVYDIETSRVKAYIWGTGKQFVNHNQIQTDTKIISIAWKWIGSDKVHSVVWDKDHNDKELLITFLKEYNKASMVIGQNNNKFDNKIVNARAAKHRLYIDRYVKSFDIMVMAKRYFRLQSFSMAYMAEYFGLTLKQSHEGIHMWDMIENGTPKEQKEYLKKMVDYNKGDIVTTEELYLTLRCYFGNVTNKAVQKGLPKWACPVSGSKDVRLSKTIFTEMGTIQRILYCEDSNHQYKVSNKTYMDFLQRAMTEHYE
jgi:uncharacterized protein YprB with RNaseH-like and TPR domain|tara:strand:+ start:43 stop:1017 length:975 start_codon:yes stop_codon:yes gene_type:complete